MVAAETWHPKEILRFIKAFPTSACTALVETDAGPGYLKAIGSDEGEHTLACEWVGSQLARWFGLSTFEFAIVDVNRFVEIKFQNGNLAKEGPAFISRAERGDKWSGMANQLRQLVNPEQLTRLVVFDTWTLNCDRHSTPSFGKTGKNRVKYDNVFLSENAPDGELRLIAMDHTHCFTCGRELTHRVRHDDTIKDARVFGLFPEFRPFLDRKEAKRAVGQLGKVGRSIVQEMTKTIPRQWQVSADARSALEDLILRRAGFVADTIERRIWPQQDLDFETSVPTENPS